MFAAAIMIAAAELVYWSKKKKLKDKLGNNNSNSVRTDNATDSCYEDLRNLSSQAEIADTDLAQNIAYGYTAKQSVTTEAGNTI